ncbi:MarR family winged helix-turn-helix transcriptional regulator [Brevirhabdus sp.]|uniref:MarR family winged helix-turn-helix transcriptional regulator n=1 Tax=Brevirhabdus sp. TaxID=2004514 RepID=UPI00405971E0
MRDEPLRQTLIASGLAAEVAADALEIDATMQRWRRRVVKRGVEREALRALSDPAARDLDVPKLDVLTAILAPRIEFGPCDTGETMVSTVAARLGIDPSRASRLVSELIEAGFARRAVSQRDARRTIVELTARGQDVVREVRVFKLGLLGRHLSGWTAEERRLFLPLLERLSAWSDPFVTAEGEGAPPA